MATDLDVCLAAGLVACLVACLAGVSVRSALDVGRVPCPLAGIPARRSDERRVLRRADRLAVTRGEQRDTTLHPVPQPQARVVEHPFSLRVQKGTTIDGAGEEGDEEGIDRGHATPSIAPAPRHIAW